jgi:hypothetical protein
MIYLSLISLLLSSVLARDAAWEVIAKSEHCPLEISIEAREGHKSIRAITDEHTFTMFPKGNYVFMQESPIDLIFDSYNRKSDHKKLQLEYLHPSVASKRKSLIKIYKDNKVIKCSMKIL